MATEAKSTRAACVRQAANWSSISNEHMFDSARAFSPTQLLADMPVAGPKIASLLAKIQQLDAHDMTTQRKHFKHVIYCDTTSTRHGAKLVASALVASGFTHVYGKDFRLKPAAELLKTRGRNVALFTSKAIYGSAMPAKLKKSVLQLYNDRPDNVHGDLIRFLILDSGGKEGLDTFDVKYVHLLEPLATQADQQQAIGRATRMCGQKGLQFHPRQGWTLHVYRYDVALPEPLAQQYGATTMFDIYMQQLGLNLDRITFAAEVEQHVKAAAIDASLNQAVHRFALPPASHPGSPAAASGGAPRRRGKAIPPRQAMVHQRLQAYMAQRYGTYRYPAVKMENGCGSPEPSPPSGSPGTAKRNRPVAVKFTPTQELLRHYFTPATPYKGMLLFQGTGVGKTCTAIATATSSFEQAGYTILWVTRHTLKNEVYKNHVQQVCNMQLRAPAQLAKLPSTAAPLTGARKYLSGNWLEPISYKTFTNMLQGRNQLWQAIKARNGAQDPLRKTLLIIDEAHKLYGPGTPKLEQPNMEVLLKMLRQSYHTSGKDSVRVLLMTATPIVADAMEMIHLLNLLRLHSQRLPSSFSRFAARYLHPTGGRFTPAGSAAFMDDVAGYVSHLDRSQDARMFAHPIIRDVRVDATRSQHAALEEAAKEQKARLKAAKEQQGHAKELQAARLKECKERAAREHALAVEAFQHAKDRCKELPTPAARRACMERVRSQAPPNKTEFTARCKSQVAAASNTLLEDVAQEAKRMRAERKRLAEQIAALKSSGANAAAQSQLQAKQQRYDELGARLGLKTSVLSKPDLSTQAALDKCLKGSRRARSSNSNSNTKLRGADLASPAAPAGAQAQPPARQSRKRRSEAELLGLDAAGLSPLAARARPSYAPVKPPKRARTTNSTNSTSARATKQQALQWYKANLHAVVPPRPHGRRRLHTTPLVTIPAAPPSPSPALRDTPSPKPKYSLIMPVPPPSPARRPSPQQQAAPSPRRQRRSPARRRALTPNTLLANVRRQLRGRK